MKDLRKALIVSVMSITVFSMSMLAVPFQAGAVAQAGDLIKMDGLSSVYYLGGDSKRYVFPNESTYFSWYSDFSSVVTIPQSELESYPLGANVTVRPGTKLVKITTDPKVYAVLPDGNLQWVPSETVAKALWGDMWAKRVIDVPDAFFTNYTIASGQVGETAYPAGSLIKLPTASDVYYIAADGKAQKITTESAFLANRFKWDDVITTASGFTLPTAGADITGAVADITDTSEGAGGTPGAGTGLTVAISGDTPAAGNIPDNTPVDFLEINLTASNDGDVNVNSITLSAYDLGSATNIDSINYYKDGIKQGTAVSMTSDRTATTNFSTPVKVMAGQTVTLLVRATIADNATGNYAVGIAKAADVLTNGAVVSGSFPIIGNTKAIVTGTNIGTVTMAGADTTAAPGTQFGTDDVKLAGFNLTSANEAVLWESAAFRNGGTNNEGIVTNLRLLIDGDEVATTPALTDKYAIFNLDNYLIAKGDTVSVEVYGDMGIANVGNTIDLYVKEVTDFVFVGQDYGFGINITRATGQLDAVSTGIVVTLAAGDFTLDMDKSATPSKEVRSGTDNVVLATIKMTSNGENATLDGLNGTSSRFYITGTGITCDEFDNVELYNVDTKTLHSVTVGTGEASNFCNMTVDDEITFTKGITKTYQVRVDLQGSNDTNEIDVNNTLQVVLKSTALTVAGLNGDESDAPITIVTPSSVSSAITTVKAASLTWTTVSLTDKTVVPGATDVVVYRAGLEVGAAGEYVDITAVQIDVLSDTTAADGSFIDNNISALKLYLDGKLLKTLSGQIQLDTNGTANDAYVNFTSLDITNRRLAAGANVYLEVKADFSASFSTSTTWTLNVDNDVDANGNNTNISSKDDQNNSVSENVPVFTGSRDITLASNGTLKVELLTNDTKADADTYILAGSETVANRYLGELKFSAANENVKVKTLVLGQTGTMTGADIAAVRLYDKNGVMVAQKAPTAAGHVNMDALNLELTADQATSLFIGIVAKSMNADGDAAGTATYARTCIFNLASQATLASLSLAADKAATAQGIDSGIDVTLVGDVDGGTVAVGQYASTTILTKEAKMTGSVLNSVVNALSDGVLTAGNGKTIGKYTFVFDNGANRTAANEELKAQMVSLALTIATSTGVNVTNVEAYIEGNSTNIATSSIINGVATLDLDSGNGLANTGKVDGTVTLVVTGNIAVTGTTQFVQTEITSLASALTYNGNNGSLADNFTNARLDVSKVSGATLSN